MIPTRSRQEFFDSLFEDAGDSCLTAMTRLEWKSRESVDYALFHMAGGVNIAELAKELAVTAATLYRWRSQANEPDLWTAYK